MSQFPDDMDTQGAILFVALMCAVAAALVLAFLLAVFAVFSVSLFALILFAVVNSFMCDVCGFAQPVMPFEVAVLVVLVAWLCSCFLK